MITLASSEADSETDTESSTSASEELISNSAETSESSDDQGGMGTVAVAVAQITIGRLTAMPNVREKDISISAKNHEPDSFSQFMDNHERGPIVEEVPHPKLHVKAMELLSSVGAYVDVPMAALLDEEVSLATLWTEGRQSSWHLQPVSGVLSYQSQRH
jgi:hypothetical protein